MMDENTALEKVREILSRGHDVEIKTSKDGVKIVEVIRITAGKDVDFQTNI